MITVISFFTLYVLVKHNNSLCWMNSVRIMVFSIYIHPIFVIIQFIIFSYIKYLSKFIAFELTTFDSRYSIKKSIRKNSLVVYYPCLQINQMKFYLILIKIYFKNRSMQ
ncbi:hypothetical protein EDEG_00784 [Edhazardia aedis USNM 41457]|uniref:Uncharacterized protein n=1 Tax=Edhazardia aedis (strain USNM 41457) TaxID=1003232 RepID=J9DCA6_EDHAE|nr:hypothetical protein EDEG_00784 [Edhazardia aedis USNM 41457]|eukprot:EJW05114.1 hypothetical protein EDEG_00784 [Edhazardia aedis USNM 41457]